MNKVAFITGASRGIGKAVAHKLASEGWDIVVAAKSTEEHPKLPGTIFTAAGVPHSPRFPPDAFVLIMERPRRDGEIDRFQWFCPSCDNFLHEETFVVGDYAVDPVSIAYAGLDGMPMPRHMRPFFAWYGDMELMDHLWTVLGLGRATVGVTFHEPVTIADFASRKEMALGCQAVVAAGVSDMLSGREAAPASAAAHARLTADRPVLESNP